MLRLVLFGHKLDSMRNTHNKANTDAVNPPCSGCMSVPRRVDTPQTMSTSWSHVS